MIAAAAVPSDDVRRVSASHEASMHDEDHSNCRGSSSHVSSATASFVNPSLVQVRKSLRSSMHRVSMDARDLHQSQRLHHGSANSCSSSTMMTTASKLQPKHSNPFRLSMYEKRLLRNCSKVLANPVAMHSYVADHSRSQPSVASFSSVTSSVLSARSAAPGKSYREQQSAQEEPAAAAAATTTTTDVVVPTGKWHNRRTRLRKFLKTREWRVAIVFCILADIVALAIDEGNGTHAMEVAASLDLLFTCVFAIEVLLKCFAAGLLRTPDSYLRKNRLRLLYVIAIVCSFVSHLTGSKKPSMRVLRGLKSFRCFSLTRGMQRILYSIARAVPFLANVGTLASFLLLAFSVFGLEAFRNCYSNQCSVAIPSGTSGGNVTMYAALPRLYCSSNSQCKSNDQQCTLVEPRSKHINFDSGLTSLFMVFLVVAQDGWVGDIMQPITESTSRWSSLFFICIVAFMVFLVVNLFVAVITTSFMNMRVGEEGDRAAESVTKTYMGKLPPTIEESHVKVIMGATLALEQSMQWGEEPIEAIPEQVEESDESDPDSPIAANNIGSGGGGVVVNPLSLVNLTAINGLNSLRSAGRSGRSGGRSGDRSAGRSGGHLTSRSGGTLTSRSQLAYDPNEISYQRMAEAALLRNRTVETTIEMVHRGESISSVLSGYHRTSADDLIPEENDAQVQAEQGTRVVSPLARAKSELKLSNGRDQELVVSPTGITDDSNPATTTVVATADLDPPKLTSFQRFVFSKRFDSFITTCILFNTLFLLLEYPQMPKALKIMLSVAEYVFGSVFVFEMVARIVAMQSVRKYLANTERFFDAIVVCCTIVNMVLNNINVSFSGLNSISSLRTLRVTRLMLKYEGTRKLIDSVLKSSRGILDVVLFLVCFQIVGSILAMEMFGNGQFTTDGQVPRWNFETFGHAFLTLLQVITGDQWSSILYDTVDADHPHALMVPFLILVFVMGQYIILNLFIAVILENFSISEEEAYQLQLEQILAIPKELQILERIDEVGVRAFDEMEKLENVDMHNHKVRNMLGVDKKRNTPSARRMTLEQLNRSPYGNCLVPLLRKLEWLHDLWLRGCRALASSQVFTQFVQVMIVLSCIGLALENPHELESEASPSFNAFLHWMNRVVLLVLIVEFVVKVSVQTFGFKYLRLLLFHKEDLLAYGNKKTYMEDPWNRMDLALLVLSLIDEGISLVDPGIKAARLLRAVRVLRPLRILNRNKEMKAILHALMHSLPYVGNVFALCMIVYIIFGVVGRSFFTQRFYYCNDDSVHDRAHCEGFFLLSPDGEQLNQENSQKSPTTAAFLVPRVWLAQRFSFDNIPVAFVALLEMTSLKWIDKTFDAMNIVGLDKQPQENAAPYNAVFFVCFVYLGSLFVVRLFVGVLVDEFQRNNGTQILTESQKCWVDLERFVLLLRPLKRIPRPKRWLRAKLYDVCNSSHFSTFISLAIMLNVILLLVNPNNDSSRSFQAIEITFLVIFSGEALVKTLGFGFHYIMSAMGGFEIGILAGSLVAYFLGTGYHGLIQAGRIFRMMRVLRFIKLNRNVQTIFQTFRASVKSIANIFFLLFLIFFIFAIVGRQLFGAVRMGPYLNNFSNFRTFQSSMMLLFQIMAGDDWHLIMTDCMVSPPFCAQDPNGGDSDCGSKLGATLYFFLFVVCVVFIFVNLFVAVVLENFRSCYIKDICDISLEDFEVYRQVFLKYDVHGTGTFPVWQLSSFLMELPPGLRFDPRKNRSTFLQLRSHVQALIELEHSNNRPLSVRERIIKSTSSFVSRRTNSSVLGSPPKTNSSKYSYLPQESISRASEDQGNRDREQLPEPPSAFAPRRRRFFNEFLRLLCIHHLGIRSLPYEQQRDRVKQIFLYRERVSRMIVESVVKGFILRWRQRQKNKWIHALARDAAKHTAMTSSVPHLKSAMSIQLDQKEEDQRVKKQQMEAIDAVAEHVGEEEEGVEQTPQEGKNPAAKPPRKHLRKRLSANGAAPQDIEAAQRAIELARRARPPAVETAMEVGGTEQNNPPGDQAVTAEGNAPDQPRVGSPKTPRKKHARKKGSSHGQRRSVSEAAADALEGVKVALGFKAKDNPREEADTSSSAAKCESTPIPDAEEGNECPPPNASRVKEPDAPFPPDPVSLEPATPSSPTTPVPSSAPATPAGRRDPKRGLKRRVSSNGSSKEELNAARVALGLGPHEKLPDVTAPDDTCTQPPKTSDMAAVASPELDAALNSAEATAAALIEAPAIDMGRRPKRAPMATTRRKSTGQSELGAFEEAYAATEATIRGTSGTRALNAVDPASTTESVSSRLGTEGELSTASEHLTRGLQRPSLTVQCGPSKSPSEKPKRMLKRRVSESSASVEALYNAYEATNGPATAVPTSDPGTLTALPTIATTETKLPPAHSPLMGHEALLHELEQARKRKARARLDRIDSGMDQLETALALSGPVPEPPNPEPGTTQLQEAKDKPEPDSSRTKSDGAIVVTANNASPRSPQLHKLNRIYPVDH